jgi:hypothetical protein
MPKPWTRALTTAEDIVFLRSNRNGYLFNDLGLTVPTAPGSIWGDFGKSNPASNTAIIMADAAVCPFLPASLPASPAAASSAGLWSVSINLRGAYRSYGAQAGLVLYSSQDDWAKCVLECMKDGVTRVVVASSTAGAPAVLAKIDTPATAGEELAAALRFTVSATGEITASTRVALASDLSPQGGTEGFYVDGKFDDEDAYAEAPWVAVGEPFKLAAPGVKADVDDSLDLAGGIYRVGLISHGSTEPIPSSTFSAIEVELDSKP